MKKKSRRGFTFLGILLSLCLLFATACSADLPGGESSSAGSAGASSGKTEGEQIRIGVTFQSLSMPTFAEFSSFMESYAPEEYGAEITIVSAEWNAPTQVSQIENFIESDVDAIIIAPVDANALTDVTKRAMDEGIYVFSYAAHLENYSTEYLVDDYNTGYACGKAAAEWINEHLDGKAEYGILEYPSNEQLISRAKGIQDALKELAPESTCVSIQKAIDANEGMEVTENMLQANPNLKVIASIGDGGAVGANEAVKAAGKATDDWGIFSVDATQEALQKIKDNEPFRASLSLGGPADQGSYMVDTVVALVRGETVEKDGRMPFKVIDKSNVEEYAKSLGWTLK